MPWSWVWVGLIGGLFVGILIQDADVQRDLWHFLPFATKVAVIRIDRTLSVLGLDAQWMPTFCLGWSVRRVCCCSTF
jgi:hypothetical protein